MKIFSALYLGYIPASSKLNRRKCALGIFRNVKCFALCVMQTKLIFAFRLDSLRLPKKVRPSAY